jgi:hypothetical protein
MVTKVSINNNFDIFRQNIFKNYLPEKENRRNNFYQDNETSEK